MYSLTYSPAVYDLEFPWSVICPPKRTVFPFFKLLNCYQEVMDGRNQSSIQLHICVNVCQTLSQVAFICYLSAKEAKRQRWHWPQVLYPFGGITDMKVNHSDLERPSLYLQCWPSSRDHIQARESRGGRSLSKRDSEGLGHYLCKSLYKCLIIL